MDFYIGCAGWTVRRELAIEFPTSGSHLYRYSRRFNAVEINTSFYRPHRFGTYQRWADSTPNEFRFAVKLPKEITHIRRLVAAESQIERFVAETSGLREKRGPILVQLPPSLAFDALIVEEFFRAFRRDFDGAIVCEPRHASWFSRDVESLLGDYAIDRAAADPSIVPEAAIPMSTGREAYFRWHGTPNKYYSSYDDKSLRDLAYRLVAMANEAQSVWCIFDNTAEGAAPQNAFVLWELMQQIDRDGV